MSQTTSLWKGFGFGLVDDKRFQSKGGTYLGQGSKDCLAFIGINGGVLHVQDVRFTEHQLTFRLD